MHEHAGAVGGGDREDAERPGVASEAHLPRGQLVVRLVVPQLGRDAAREREPAGVVVLAERAKRSLELRHRRRVAVGEARHEAV